VVWKRVSPGDLGAAPCNIVEAEKCVLLVLDVRGLQGFDDISKVGLLVFLEL